MQLISKGIERNLMICNTVKFPALQARPWLNCSTGAILYARSPATDYTARKTTRTTLPGRQLVCTSGLFNA